MTWKLTDLDAHTKLMLRSTDTYRRDLRPNALGNPDWYTNQALARCLGSIALQWRLHETSTTR